MGGSRRVGALLKRTGWKFSRNVEVGHAAQRVVSFADRMRQSAERLRASAWRTGTRLDVIRDYDAEPTVGLYVDPPYLGSTRATNYRVEMLDDDAHRTFADALNECKASVVLSGYDSPLYAELFDGWHRKDIAAPTTLSGDTDRTEVPPPTGP